MTNFITTLFKHPIIILFIIANLAIGLWAHRKSKAGSFEDYALASRSLPIGVLVMTLLGTLVGGGSLLDASWAYRYGLLQILGTIFYCILLFLVGTFVAPSLVYYDRAFTMGDLMKRFYGITAQRLTALVGIFVSLLIVSSQMQTIGKVSSLILGIDPVFATLAFGFIITICSTWGGMRSVSYTDVLQLVLTIFVINLVCQTLIQKIGGLTALTRSLSSEKLLFLHHPRFLKKMKMVSFWVIFPTFLLTPPIFQRLLLTKNKQKSRNAWYATALIYSIISSCIVFIGITASAGRELLNLEDTHRDLLPRVIKVIFKNKNVLDFIFIGIISVLISTIDSFIHSISISITHDLINTINIASDNKGSKGGNKILITKLITTIISFLTIAMSLTGKTKHLTNLIFYSYAIFLYAMVLVPLLIGIIGIKTDKLSLASFCGTYITSLFIFHYYAWDKHIYFFLSVLLSIIAYLLTHLYINGGIVTLKRSRHTTAERLWVPSWTNLSKAVKGWIHATFNLRQVALIEVSRGRPTQSLGFSMLIFFLYTLSTMISTHQEGFPEFMAAIHFVGIVLCCGLMLEGMWPRSIEAYFPLYWLATLFYCLPLSATITFLRMHEGVPSMFFFVGSFVFLASLVSSRAFFWMSLWAVGLGHLGWYLVHGSLPSDLWTTTYAGAGLALGILLLFIAFFGHNAEAYVDSKLYVTKALASAVPHEVRDPLNEVSFVGFASDQLNTSLVPIKNEAGEEGFFLPKRMKGHVEGSGDKIRKSLEQVKLEFSRFQKLLDGDINTEAQEKVSMAALMEECLPTLPEKYMRAVEVKVQCIQDFEAYLIRPFFGNVLANMLKNAKRHGNASQLNIIIDGQERQVRVRDNGLGIPAEALPRIFDLGFTTGGDTSSGVGLALIKLILNASGIHINSHARHGDKDSFTEFVIDFPRP